MIESSRTRSGSITAVAALCGFEAGAIALLHRLGDIGWMTIPRGSLRSWLDMAPIEDVVAAGLRSIALGVAYWIAASTAAYGLARISRVPRLIRATAWATLPPIRRTIDRAIAVTVTAAALASPIAPAIAAEIPSPPEPIIFQLSDGGVPTPVDPPVVGPTVILPPGIGGAGYTPHPAGGVSIGEESETVGPGEASHQAGASMGGSIREVVAGDNLWTISAAHLRATFPDREVDTDEIATYWRRVIEANTAGLRSGNPNLIYPGEQIVMPHPGSGEKT